MALVLPFMPYYLPEEEITDLSEQTSYSGKAAELAVRSWLTFNGRTCSVPEIDRSGVDLWVDGNKRAQVKKVVWKKGGGNHTFWWQNPSARKRYTRDQVDLFYQVILTPLRLVIFEVPSHTVPVGKDGQFKLSTDNNLCVEFHQHKRPLIALKDYCVHQVFHPTLFAQ